MKGVIRNLLNKLSAKDHSEPEKFSPQLWDRLQNGPEGENMIVARALSTTNRLSRWVVIYQRKSNDIRDQYFKLRYTVHEFELPNNIMGSDHAEKVNKKTWYVRREDEIYELLSHIGIRPGNFSLPAMSNYPFKS